MINVFGNPRQAGYVVRDLEAEMQRWIALGIGPWFHFSMLPVTGRRFRGEPAEFEIAIAVANMGDLQIELIEQLNDAPSMYREFQANGGDGFHHLSGWSDDFVTDLARIEAAGFTILQEGAVGESRFVYFGKDGDLPATVMELYDSAGASGEFFKSVRAAAAEWDGSEPIRRVM